MWKLQSISANNLCAFRQMHYTIQQNRTTLIFGNNLDNDSQGSNGSGKSALIEAIAIGLTGEPLRNIKRDEIINDMAEEATVELILTNDESDELLTIHRNLSRKNPQSVIITIRRHDEVVDVAQPSVADYNKYVLETIGLSKDDIYSNFILSKHKYTSFLSSSDKDKKEIINRFSNGIMVDESLEALQADMDPIAEELKFAEGAVSIASGKVTAINEQIATEIAEVAEKSQNKINRIADLQAKIQGKRENVRLTLSVKCENEKYLEQLDQVDESLQELERADNSIAQAQESIAKMFAEVGIDEPDDYIARIEEMNTQLETFQSQQHKISENAKEQEDVLSNASRALSRITKQYTMFEDSYATESIELKNTMHKLANDIEALQQEQTNLQRNRQTVERTIATLESQLAGVIACPKCHHEFTLAGNVNIDEVRVNIKENGNKLTAIQQKIELNDDTINQLTAQGQDKRKEYNQLVNKQASLSEEVADAQRQVNTIQSNINQLSSQLLVLAGKIEQTTKRIEGIRTELFDQAFDILDGAIKACEATIKQAEINIDNANGHIASYKESIKELESSSTNDLLDSLNKSKERYEQELHRAIATQESIDKRLSDYKTQEATFIEFKTHLANTKINDLGRITNEFLERIGSDIRIAFSGYTVLKSGKIRDKISISLIRDGVDCGSFDKFSEGEKARVNLANILAMHKLTNVNCLEGKGLDLLVLDEILDATDESGLANIFDALNSLQITSLVVSHGNIAENYPYKLIVNKQNGVSFIND